MLPCAEVKSVIGMGLWAGAADIGGPNPGDFIVYSWKQWKALKV